MTNERLTRDQQREAARAKAKAMREAQKIKAGRRKVIMLSSAVVGSLALVGGIFWYATSNPAPIVEPDTNPSTAIFDGGVRIGKDLKVITSAADVDPTVPNIVIYEDLQCPACRAFEAPNMPQIRELVASGKYTVQIHPISFLDGSSVNEYSSRAANALLCVADTQADKFLDFNGALYSNQPSEGTPGPTNEQLQSLAAEAGVRLMKKAVAVLGFQHLVRHRHLEGVMRKQLLPDADAVVIGQRGTAINADANAYGNRHGVLGKEVETVVGR